MAIATAYHDFVPTVRVDEVRAATGKRLVSLPGTTLAYATANIFARASGYVDKRHVEIGHAHAVGRVLGGL